MRTLTALLMSGLAFTVGLLCGLLIHLPAESLPAADFEGHHLGRVRRVAEADPAAVRVRGESANNRDNYVDNADTQSGLILTGTANKQADQGDYSDNTYKVQNLADNGYQVISGGKSQYFGALNKYPSKVSDSVVYVNPAGQKLVLNNNVNKSADHNQLTDPRGSHKALGNNVVPNNAKPAGQLEDGLDSRGHLAGGQTMPDSYRNSGWGENDVIQGVFWGKNVEHACPKGFTEEDHMKWKTKVADGKFIKMIDGCGRMQNRLLTFSNLDKACARYRLNVDQIQGEIYSYYLSKLLGINNVPPSTLQLARADADRWRLVSQEVANAKWSEEKPVILSRWIENLSPAYIPTEFRNLTVPLHARDVKGTLLSDNSLVNAKTGSSLCELLQWSDLIVFDYLTGNLDRVVNNLFNLQWNEKMMSKPTHNLESASDGNLVFLDNESGLFHGYRLLDKYSPYHESLLNSLCIFREGTVRKIRSFVDIDSVGDALQSLFEKHEPLHKYVPQIPVKNIKLLKQRMGDILSQVEKCEAQS